MVPNTTGESKRPASAFSGCIRRDTPLPVYERIYTLRNTALDKGCAAGSNQPPNAEKFRMLLNYRRSFYKNRYVFKKPGLCSQHFRQRFKKLSDLSYEMRRTFCTLRSLFNNIRRISCAWRGMFQKDRRVHCDRRDMFFKPGHGLYGMRGYFINNRHLLNNIAWDKAPEKGASRYIYGIA